MLWNESLEIMSVMLQGSGFLSKIIGQDKKEQYIKEQEREVQSGNTT